MSKPERFKVINDAYWPRITPKIDTTTWLTEEWRGNRFKDSITEISVRLMQQKQTLPEGVVVLWF